MNDLMLDLDFDVVTDVPVVIEGKVNIMVPWGLTGIDSPYLTFYMIAKLRKYSGTTETEIASTQTDSYQITANKASIWPIVINAPETKFKKGDTIRLTLLVYDVDAGTTAAGQTFYIVHDPEDRDVLTGEDTSVLSVNIPFVVDT